MHIFSDDEDMFFDGPNDSSFVFSVTEGTPSPQKNPSSGGLKKKYKRRDSGVVMGDDEGSNINWDIGGTLGASGSVVAGFVGERLTEVFGWYTKKTGGVIENWGVDDVCGHVACVCFPELQVSEKESGDEEAEDG